MRIWAQLKNNAYVIFIRNIRLDLYRVLEHAARVKIEFSEYCCLINDQRYPTNNLYCRNM